MGSRGMYANYPERKLRGVARKLVGTLRGLRTLVKHDLWRIPPRRMQRLGRRARRQEERRVHLPGNGDSFGDAIPLSTSALVEQRNLFFHSQRVVVGTGMSKPRGTGLRALSAPHTGAALRSRFRQGVAGGGRRKRAACERRRPGWNGRQISALRACSGMRARAAGRVRRVRRTGCGSRGTRARVQECRGCFGRRSMTVEDAGAAPSESYSAFSGCSSRLRPAPVVSSVKARYLAGNTACRRNSGK
ncbi:hypothetical protein GGX14DRAFT_610415 [Mycena pura]|uniref:Uncharacterized protein n=1 Tax=Mycena pura TaxID=153505 RepID=A0AAD6UP92_9AGAR|nr:hypothetical protein GGX14DRAFT_610415 [Mycena pura]